MNTPAYTKELLFAKELAAKACQIALKYYKTDLAFETKEDASPVTIADKEVNDMVIRSVQDQFPEHGVLGEEHSWHPERSQLWVCDPIDGTIAFCTGDPTFMFSLALAVDGKPVVAVAADPAAGTIFYAVKGAGAFANEKPIHVSERPLHKAWMVFPTNLKRLYGDQKMYQTLDEAGYQTNIIHGGVFKGILVAQGLADAAVWSRTVHPWDMAAVKLIVEEAGGRFTDRNGAEHRFDEELQEGVIVTNGVVHDQVLEILSATL